MLILVTVSSEHTVLGCDGPSEQINANNYTVSIRQIMNPILLVNL